MAWQPILLAIGVVEGLATASIVLFPQHSRPAHRRRSDQGYFSK
ncbi:MAG: hypothetical protein ACYDBT_08225 [Desulfobulbaceae bacterium]